ncbi:hypothetical protein ACET3Z_028882 [Daucus carota]
MPSSELVKSRKGKLEFILITAVLLVVLVGLILLSVYKKRKLMKEESLKLDSESVSLTKIENEDLELPLYDFESIAHATKTFCN